MADPTFTIQAVTTFLVMCDVEGCGWEQRHVSQENATRDARRHLTEWHSGKVLDHAGDWLLVPRDFVERVCYSGSFKYAELAKLHDEAEGLLDA